MRAYQALLSSLKRGVISPVYLFYGTVGFMRQEAVAALKQYFGDGDNGQLNITVLDAEKTGLTEVIEAANTLPLFSEKRLVVVENAPYFKNRRKKGEEEQTEQDDGSELLLNYLAAPNPTACLVFVSPEGVNKNKKTFKALEKSGQALEFAPIKGRELEEWVADQFAVRGKKIEKGALQYLLTVSSDDPGILTGEIEKLSLLDLKSNAVDLTQVKLATSTSAEANVFQLVDHIGNKQSAMAIKLLREMLSQGEPPVKLLIMISRQLRLILAAKSIGNDGYTQNQVSATLGIHPYVGQKIMQQARNFSPEQLQLALENCLEIDIALKTGRGVPALLLEMGIICIGTSQPFNLSA